MTFIEHRPTGTWRGSPFIEGGAYRVVAEAPSCDGHLAEGELLKYVGSYYGCYYGVSIYAFVGPSGVERTWLLYDDEPIEKWSSVFRAVSEAG